MVAVSLKIPFLKPPCIVTGITWCTVGSETDAHILNSCYASNTVKTAWVPERGERRGHRGQFICCSFNDCGWVFAHPTECESDPLLNKTYTLTFFAQITNDKGKASPSSRRCLLCNVNACIEKLDKELSFPDPPDTHLSLIHISEPTRHYPLSRMPSSA